MNLIIAIAVFGLWISCVSVQSEANVVLDKNNRKDSSSMLAEITRELFEKSRGNPIINLNLSAVFLLLLLKAAAVGAAYIGNGSGKGRKFDEGGDLVSPEDMTLALGYLMGETCLYRAACEVPDTAKEYLGPIDMIVEAMKIISKTTVMDNEYEKKLAEFRKAIEYGELKDCPPEYTCKKANISNFLRPQ